MPDTDDLDLYELSPGVHALVPPAPREFGDSNIGIVVDPDGVTLIDTLATPRRAHVAKKMVTELVAELELPIKRVALTSSRVAFAGGSWAFWQSAFLGSEPTSEQLDEPANLLALRRLLPRFAGDYHEEFETRPVTHTVSDAVQLTDALVGFTLPGESAANLVLAAPGADVVFAGALASFGVTPLAFDGDPAAWADSCDALVEAGSTVVPGHGPPGGAADLRDLADYLRACVAADGDPSAIPAGPWDRWADRRFDAVNVERAARLARGDHSTPHAMFELLGLA